MTLIGHRSQNHPQQTAARGALETTDDRRTPPDLLAECAELAHVTAFDLDVAATADNSIAPQFCTDGLAEPWHGRVWCNPPYSNIRPWVSKAHYEATILPRVGRGCDVVAMLLPANRTEQRWWQDDVEPSRLLGDIKVYFLAGRRRFDRPGWTKPAKGDRPPFGLCLLVWEAA